LKRQLGSLVVAAGLLITTGCRPDAEAPVTSLPVEVTTTPVIRQDTSLSYTYGGRVVAFRQVEVRARVAGIVLHRLYVEGALVKVGEELYQIDPTPYEIAVARAVAQSREFQARHEKAARDLARATILLASRSGTVLARDDAQTALAVADAGLAAAQADVRAQLLNLSYTRVTAPLSGISSLETVTEGSLVGTGAESSLLTRVTQTDPIYVGFSFDNDDLTEIRRLVGGDGKAARLQLPAQILADGQARDAVVNFADSSIDQATGTVRGRASLANPDGWLMPGQFVQVVVGGVTLHDGLAVPKIAVGQDAVGPFVYVADHGRARRLGIELRHEARNDWVVSGLHPGDAVITEGMVRIRDGDPIRVAQP
jgi:membrane fusion protein (multidrug efflux system)